MKLSEVNECILNCTEKLNISKDIVRIASDKDSRKECFNELQISYFPAMPDSTCEVLFADDFSKYLILIFSDNIDTKEHFYAELFKTATNAICTFEKYKNDLKSGNVLLMILSDYLNGRKSELTLNDDVRRLAKNHEVTSLVYYQTKDEKLQNSYYNAVRDFSVRKSFLEKIKAEFLNVGIEYYFVKGIKVAELYPTPALRIMGDCDIHLHEKDKQKAAEILKNLGFMEQIREGLDEWRYLKNNLVFELHDNLCYEQENASEKERNFLLNEWKHCNNGELENEFHFIYLLSHLKKHLIGRGVGLRQFVDLAVEIKFGQLDFDIVLDYAEQAQLKGFLLVCLALCEKWFKIDAPYKAEITEEFFKKATFVILHNGVFGMEKVVNEHDDFAKQVNFDGKIKTIITSVFLPYNAFVGEYDYSWLMGRKYLLPIAWIVRLIKKFTNKDSRKKGLYTVDKITTSQRKVSEFEEWGIL